MKTRSWLVLLLIILTFSACSLQAAASPQEALPTYTPYPTNTPYPDPAVEVFEFALTYGPDGDGLSGIEDPTLICQLEFGPDSRQADWIDLEFYFYDGNSAEDLHNALGLAPDELAWISLATQMRYSGEAQYAVISQPTMEVRFNGLDAVPGWSEPAFALTHRRDDPMLPWLPALCIMEEQVNKQ